MEVLFLEGGGVATAATALAPFNGLGVLAAQELAGDVVDEDGEKYDEKLGDEVCAHEGGEKCR